MTKKNVTSGKTVHLGDKGISIHTGETFYSTRCGSDHATNRPMREFKPTSREVTCKKCLKQLEKSNLKEIIVRHSSIEEVENGGES